MRFTRRTFLALTIAAVLAGAGAAQAAPDWTPPRDLSSDPQPWAVASIGFASDGTELAAHIEVVSLSPLSTTLTFARRRAGGSWATEHVVDDAGGGAGNVDLAVAPSGAAVAAWEEYTKPDDLNNSPVRYRAAFRSPDGTWGTPLTLAAPLVTASFNARIVAAIAPDGTAAAGAVADEPNGFGELQADTNVFVAVRTGGGWGPSQELSPPNAAATGLQLAFDDSDQLTAAWSERYSEGATASTLDDGWRIVTRSRAASNGIWSSPDDLTSSAGSAGWPTMAIGAGGRAVVAWQWTKPDSTLDAWSSSRPSAAGAWSGPERIVHAVASGPLAAGIAPDGTEYLEYWSQAAGTASAIGVERRPAGGTWGSPLPLRTNVDGSAGRIAFAGNDAVLGFQSLDKGAQQHLVEAARWSSGAGGPDALRDIEEPNKGGSLAALVNDRRGSIVALWYSPQPRYAVLDGGGPELVSSDVPASAVAGQSFDASVTFADMWSPLGDGPSWDFGDGSQPSSGAAASHVYLQAGTHTVSVRASDVFGNETTTTFTVQVVAPAASPAPAPTAPQPGARDTAKPVVTLAKPPCRPHETKRACALRRGTPSAWRLLRGTVRDAAPSSGIARVEVAVTLLRHGRATASPRFGKASRKGHSWSLRTRGLRRGTYVFRVRAVDAAGNVSTTVARRVRLR